jgi:tetratricopeptide (TPR) repeat protein
MSNREQKRAERQKRKARGVERRADMADRTEAKNQAARERLEPLTESDAGQIVEELLGSLEPAVRARIAEASEGNPLYVEQIVSMLVETGAIERGMDGWVARAGSSTLQIPPTVQALVAARLDALGPAERGVVEPASVIGLSFPEDAVGELVESGIRAQLETELGVLIGKQLVRRAGGDEAIYRFGHQVIRDTAYGSLLKRLRAALHERFVVWAERVNKERGRELEFEEILGFHLEQAYRYRTEIGLVDDEARSVGERAATKLGSAGRRALARGDIPASVSLLRRAIDLLPREADFRLELMIDLAEGLLQQGSFDAAGLVLDDIRTIAVERDDEPLRVRGDLVRMWMEQFRSGGEGGAARALAAATAAIEVLEPIGDAAGLARAWRLRMVTEVLQGQLEEAGRDAERVIAYAREAGDTRLSARSAGTIAYVLLHGPTPVDEAINRCEELIAGVEGDRTAEAVLLGTLGVLRSMAGSFDDARELYQRGQAISAELGSGLVESSSSIDTSRVELLANDIPAAERELRRDYEALTAIDETYFRSTIAAYLAQVLWLAGDADGALAFSQVAEEIGDADDVLTQVPWRSARAKVLASRGDVETARRLATEAVELAAATPMTHLRADALTDLAEVLGVTGDHESAGPPLQEALDLYEQKGDVVSAQRLRDRISAVPAA